MTISAGQSTFQFRQPRQERSIDSWERILNAGMQLLIEEGWEALTITSVCRLANVTAPTIYARVDGLSGLFWAVYERGMQRVIETQVEYLEAAGRTPAESRQRLEATVDVVARTFEEHKEFLQPVIRYASVNSMLLERGASESRELVKAMAGLLPIKDQTASLETAQSLYTEAVFRAMYGGAFLTQTEESFENFRKRLIRAAAARSEFLV